MKKIADCKEFRQLIIDTVVAKKIFKIDHLKEFFDAAIEANSHLDPSSLTEIVNDICKLLSQT